MEEKCIIKPHSFIDIITNSSTEMFILDSEKTLDFVKAFIEELEQKYPTEYNAHIHVYEIDENEEDYFYDSEDETANLLRRNGYTVEKIEDWTPKKVVKISCERGCMNRTFVKIIEETFNTKIDCDG